MKNTLEQNSLLKPAKVGEIIEGKIIGRAKSAVFLDLEVLGTGIIFGKEFQEARSELRNLKIEESIFAKIIEIENEDGYVELSLGQASDELNWDKVFQKKEKGETITVKISGANKGGLLANVFNIPAFLPVSQLSPENWPKVEKGDTNKILKELQSFVGKELKVKIFNLNQKQNKLILSEKTVNNLKIKNILKNYKLGDIVNGKITGITDFGAFIQFSAKNSDEGEEANASPSTLRSARVKEEDARVEGLIHISEIDWQLIDNPSEIIKPGEKVKAKIISIENDKVFLSLKALKKDPWEEIEKKYKKSDIITAKVTKFNPFGAFVQLTPKTQASAKRERGDEVSSPIQGLCHISEFGTKAKMETALEIGKKYNFQILSIEPKKYRISLKLYDKKTG